MRGSPNFKHIDELDWVEVSRVQYADRTASVHEVWFELTPTYQSFYNKWDPGAVMPVHGFHGNHGVLVLEGEVRCGTRVCGRGTHIMLEYGDTFGPWVAGPEGAVLSGWTADGNGLPFIVEDDPAFFALLKTLEAKPVPLPPPPVGPWVPRMKPRSAKAE